MLILETTRRPKNQTPLKDRLWLTIPQCQALMGKSREWVEARISSGDFSTAKDGQRLKIVTRSVIDWVDAQTKAQRDRVGLQTAA